MTDSKEPKWAPWHLAFVGIAMLLIAGAIFTLIRDWPSSDAEVKIAGAWGDFFGGHLAGAGTIAAALLFFVAVSLQSKELGAQREELSLTRKEMKASREVSMEQVAQLRQQTAISRHSAHISRILEVMQIQSALEDKQRPLNLLLPNEYVQHEQIERQICDLTPILSGLLSSDILSGDELEQYSKAASHNSPSEVLRDYVQPKLDVGATQRQTLALRLHIRNASRFPIRVEEVRFFFPRKEIEQLDELPDSPKWTPMAIPLISAWPTAKATVFPGFTACPTPSVRALSRKGPAFC